MSSVVDNLPAFGRMAQEMKDHLYILERGHLFSTPSVAARFTLRFYVMIVIDAKGGEILLEASDGTVLRASAMVARPSAERVVSAHDAQLIALLVNPLHPLFPSFRAIGKGGAMPLEHGAFLACLPGMQAAYRGELDIVQAAALYEQVIEITARQLPPPRARRGARGQAELAEWLANPVESLDQLADRVGVSSDRMSKLFLDVVGLPMRSYHLWRKTHRVAILFSQGLSLTEIAHEAGFTDSAHMCHMFQEVFGGPPSHFLRSDLVEVRAWLGQPGSPSPAATSPV